MSTPILRRPFLFLVGILFGVFLSSVPVFAQHIGTTSSPLSVATDTVWNGPISVCWNFDGRDSEKIVVQQAIATTWEKQSSVRFVGWARCTASAANIRISIHDR
jgi:hypothetical protein